MTKEIDWTAKAKISQGRHATLQIALACITIMCVFGGAITGCTVYNVKKLDRPVDYTQKYEENYSRGGSGNSN